MKLLVELKNRNVLRVGFVYVVASLAVIETADLIFPTFNAPAWINQVIIVLAILGLPIALGLAWAFDITPEGIKSAAEVEMGERLDMAQNQNQNSNRILIALMTLVIVIILVDRFFLRANDLPPDPGPGPQGIYNIDLGDMQRQPQGNILATFDFSPDGSKLVSSSYLNGSYHIRVRELNRLGSYSILTSQSNFNFPRISPDNQRVLLRNDDGFYVTSIASGDGLSLISAGANFNSFAWLNDQESVFSPLQEQTLHKVSIISGDVEPLPIASIEGEIHRSPTLLPDGNHLLFSVIEARNSNVGANSTGLRIELIGLESGEQKVLIENAFAARYVSSGHLVFMRGDDLWGVPFDLESLEIAGQEILLISGIENFSGEAWAAYSVSTRGQLVYIEGQDLSNYLGASFSLVWINADQSEELLPLPAANYFDPVISSDGSHLAATIYQPNGSRDIWVYPFGGTPRQVTFSNDSSNPLWTPDGRQLAYIDIANGLGIWTINTDGTGQAEQLFSSTTIAAPSAFSSDGSRLVYIQGNHPTWDLQLLSFDEPEKIHQPLISTEFQERQAAISPDGNWIAYMSDRSGTYEVYISPFPEVGNTDTGTRRISTNSGIEPQWSPDGELLYYINQANSTLVSVTVDTSAGFSWGAPTEVAQMYDIREDGPNYAVDPNEQRILIMKPLEGTVPRAGTEPVLAVVIANIFDILNSRVPPFN